MKNKGHLRALPDPKSVFPETHGEEIENRTLLVTGSGVPDLIKYLTVYNTSVAFQISQLKKTQKRNPYKAEQIQKEIDELSQDLFIKYYHTDENGNVLIPIGFWYLCESVEWKSEERLAPSVPSFARDYQDEAIRSLLTQKRAMAVLATGCHHKDQGLLMYDGSVKKAIDIQKGDFLMGPDSKKREVVSLHRGRDMMYKVVPVKGTPFVVNKDHILSLKITEMIGKGSRWTKRVTTRLGEKFLGGDIVNMSVEEYAKQSKNFKHVAKLYRTGVIFNSQDAEKKLPIDPYVLGVWLGDGSSNNCDITTMDKEILQEVRAFCDDQELVMEGLPLYRPSRATTYRIKRRPISRRNTFRDSLISLNLINNKHIPIEYKTASRESRLALLAGIIDTDGSLVNDGASFDIVFKSKALAEDTIFLARSLGFAAYGHPCKKMCCNSKTKAIGDYFRFAITGNTEEIPVHLPRKKAKTRGQIKDVLKTGFHVLPLGEDDFYGFTVDEDHLYLMDDFTVTHNCGKTIVLYGICESAIRAGKRTCVIVPTVDLVAQTSSAIAKYLESLNLPKPPVVSGAGGKFKYKTACDVLVSTPVTARQYVDRFSVVAIDECHHSPAATWFALGLAAKEAEYCYGLTATPIRSDNLELGIHAWCGPVVISRSARWGIENKWLTPIEVTSVMVDLHKRLPDNYSKPFAYKLATLNKVTAECLRRIIQSLLDKNHKVVVLFATIKAGKYLSDYCKTKGLEFDVSHEKYKVPFFDFKSGKTSLLVSNNKLLGEGIDIPNITAIINVCNMKSEGVARQIVGRAVRLFPGKEQAKIIDVSFNNFSQFVQFAEYRKDIYRTIVDEIKEVTYDPCKK